MTHLTNLCPIESLSGHARHGAKACNAARVSEMWANLA